MSKTRMEWGWAGQYPIFVYMIFISHNFWNVKVVKGKKNEQNVTGCDSEAPAWFGYVSKKCSRSEVYEEAIAKAKVKLKEQPLQRDRTDDLYGRQMFA